MDAEGFTTAGRLRLWTIVVDCGALGKKGRGLIDWSRLQCRRAAFTSYWRRVRSFGWKVRNLTIFCTDTSREKKKLRIEPMRIILDVFDGYEQTTFLSSGLREQLPGLLVPGGAIFCTDLVGS
jgi:hypothetical protein